MSVEREAFDVFAEVEFRIEPGTNITHWINDDGEKAHRMEGIYPDIVTEDDIKRHWAFNLLANGVSDASSLDGWADLPKGAIRFYLIHQTLEVEPR